jgi:hypothetical protein
MHPAVAIWPRDDSLQPPAVALSALGPAPAPPLLLGAAAATAATTLTLLLLQSTAGATAAPRGGSASRLRAACRSRHAFRPSLSVFVVIFSCSCAFVAPGAV